MYSNCVLRETRKGNTEMLLVQGQGRAGCWRHVTRTFFSILVYIVFLCGDNLLIRFGWHIHAVLIRPNGGETSSKELSCAGY